MASIGWQPSIDKRQRASKEGRQLKKKKERKKAVDSESNIS